MTHKQFSLSDYCFAIESFPRCSYEQLRDILVLPSTRKIQSVVSSLEIESVFSKTFQKLKAPQQKNVFLLIDEVKIRPTVSFSGGVLSGMAKNEPDSRATSMLCIMVKCLHGGPSIMLSVIPVHTLTASCQFEDVKKATALVEKTGGIVLGSITDNHKINQLYCKMFDKEEESSASAKHPLDANRSWYLLFDTVHLLKCIRNNWITEKSQRLTLDNMTVGSFSDVKTLYELEKNSILKTTRLTYASVNPSKLQLQNVQHVLRIFHEKVIAGLALQGCSATAEFIQFVLNWWNTVNVSAKGQDIRMKDPHRAAQVLSSDSLDMYAKKFEEAMSGQGLSRKECLTHDTKKALVQTMRGLSAVTKHLLSSGFQYVLLREIQSDRIEGEFSVYRQSTGANAFMTAGDVISACKKRLARHAASFLESIDVTADDSTSTSDKHRCCGPLVAADGEAIESSISDVTLTANEESCCAYVAGWLERKCIDDITFSDDEPFVSTEVKNFLEEVSRGSLKTPHMSTYELTRIGLSFVKKAKQRVCCRRRLVGILSTMGEFHDFDIVQSKKLLRHLANVLLCGLHNLEKDHQKNATLLQTSIKKARMAD